MSYTILKKDFQRLINETASGFKPKYGNTPATQPVQKPINNDVKTQNEVSAQQTTSNVADYDRVELVNDPKVRSGAEWAKYGGNFPIKRNGKIFYVSRSVAVSLATFCQNANGDWCVLANQRGPSCHNPGLWNIPAGYLDYGESAEDAAARETWEETGVDIPADVPFRLLGTNANSHRDDVSMAYTCVLDGTIDDYPLSAENSEPGEVSDIKWIPIMTADGRPIKTFWKFKWNRDPRAIYARAQTALLPHIGTNDKYDALVKRLKREIGANPTAQYLLDKILSMKTDL